MTTIAQMSRRFKMNSYSAQQMGSKWPVRRVPRIFINASSAKLGGGQTYLINLLKHIPTGQRAEIFILAPKELALRKHDDIKRIAAPRLLTNPFTRAAWERLYLSNLLQELSCDVLFCPGGLIGTKVPPGCKTATMFQNLIPFDDVQRKRYPLGYTRLRNALLRSQLLHSFINADLVIFLADYSKKVIESAAGRGLKRSLIIPHGLNADFRINAAHRRDRLANLPERYFLYASSIDRYKAQVNVIRAYAILRRERPQLSEKLVLLGPINDRGYHRAVLDEVSKHKLGDTVLVLGKLAYEQMPAAYQNASVNIFASESENCPNILLEALASGQPVLCSDRPPMPEFAGDAVLYFDPRAPLSLYMELCRVLDDGQLATRMRSRAIEQSSAYKWSETASKTWAALTELATAPASTSVSDLAVTTAN